MSISKDEAIALLRRHDLRVTAPRLAVVRVLAEARNPMAHVEVLSRLGETDWAPATIYRNLVKLRDAGLAVVVSRAAGSDRYALALDRNEDHLHPHFVCDDCGLVSCLPTALTASISAKGIWAASVEQATVQLRGQCPDCLTGPD